LVIKKITDKLSFYFIVFKGFHKTLNIAGW